MTEFAILTAALLSYGIQLRRPFPRPDWGKSHQYLNSFIYPHRATSFLIHLTLTTSHNKYTRDCIYSSCELRPAKVQHPTNRKHGCQIATQTIHSHGCCCAEDVLISTRCISQRWRRDKCFAESWMAGVTAGVTSSTYLMLWQAGRMFLGVKILCLGSE